MNTQILAVEAEQLQAKGEELIRAVKESKDHTFIKQLVTSGSAAWVQDEQGWTALHYAAEQGNSDLCELLLRNGAVWNITSNTGHTAGDVAFSLQHATTYAVLLNEGIRHQMLQAILAADGGSEDSDDGSDAEEEEELLASTASDNAAFLKSRLRFITAEDGQEVCVDSEENGVMMGWEREIMLETARQLCENHESEELAVVNCGFGLGIIDEALQSYKPTRHVIIEAHPDVLARMKATGWYEKLGVEIFEGRWQDWLAQMYEDGGVGGVFDALYWDTFSEHYKDLHAFFDVLPNLMRDEHSRFSFFHGLGATSRSFYDVYTSVAEMHLEEVGVKVTWSEVPVTNSEVTWKGIVREYWNVPSNYRLPLGKLMG